jgi:hypothetical protein
MSLSLPRIKYLRLEKMLTQPAIVLITRKQMRKSPDGLGMSIPVVVFIERVDHLIERGFKLGLAQ